MVIKKAEQKCSTFFGSNGPLLRAFKVTAASQPLRRFLGQNFTSITFLTIL